MRVRVVTEKEGWILHRKAIELKREIPDLRINEDWDDADIHYYINYGFLRARPKKGLLLANFTHYEPDGLAEKFFEKAHLVDHCISVSERTTEDLVNGGIPAAKITTIPVGASEEFKPRLRLGIVGRQYKNGRKGEDLVQYLLDDPEVCQLVDFVALYEGWGVPVEEWSDRARFYRSLDYLLVPALIEGGPVPFMEALACGTLSIAPPIGVIPSFPHVEYPVGNREGLRATVLKTARRKIEQSKLLTGEIELLNWQTWALRHRELFESLLRSASVSVG